MMKRSQVIAFDLIVIGYIIYKLLTKWKTLNPLQIGAFLFAILIWIYIFYMTKTGKYIDIRDKFKTKEFKAEWFND